MCAVAYFIVLLFMVNYSEPYRIDVSVSGEYDYEKQQDDEGNYNYINSVYPSIITRGVHHQEIGTVAKSKSDQDGNNIMMVHGQYYYNDGLYLYEVTYTADENGFRAHVKKAALSTLPEAGGHKPELSFGAQYGRSGGEQKLNDTSGVPQAPVQKPTIPPGVEYGNRVGGKDPKDSGVPNSNINPTVIMTLQGG